ncbi:MAG: alpha-amylase family glycosyl hydrolase [Paracoccus sp. (in: a-proteobacteria)]|uniref:alpha-amylase family glycosyl hydrolase n=1 Tax=Paracoccus sp. TaxID=267 RepID=UPI0026E0C940|nr:alpha-amylase family glycosyl hydrolase [Paracoccus sp. (in: a-proteobacteria)]MDO5631666.1 alpha-amylase family glycosyl hydrolase [Paracoccus sp. (in: a-proteobacteria)]
MTVQSDAPVPPSSVPAKSQGTDIFDLRMARSAPDLWPMLERLYGQRADFAEFCAQLDQMLRDNWRTRPPALKRLDLVRDLEPDWFQRPRMVGYVFYIDRFAGKIADIHARLDYLQSLGVTYVHLMPCLMPRPGDSDGGYSVMDYTRTNPDLGSMADLTKLATALRERGMSLCIDLVLNHTAKEHEWARRAAAGERDYQDMYLMFDDDTLPRRYEETLIEIFPDTAPGSFTHYPDFGKWVWTTFNEHQWDLNWANPRVFLEIVQIMLNLANKGVDVLRLDAVAFMWKRMGTTCQSQPEVHVILRALRACTRIAAGATIHLEEAIVGPAEMLTYFGRGEHDGHEGNLAYHNSLMVQYWAALATRDTRLMTYVMGTHFPAQLTNATYANYIRCHDDIGWAITDEDAGALGISGPGHRGFLSNFYDGSFPGTFASGALFQVNPETGDKRISGSFASLAGLETAANDHDRQLAVNRILMGTALIAAWGGIPLIYMGDEIGLLNDHSYQDRPAHAHDSRWIHRPMMDWDRVAHAEAHPDSPEGQILHGTRAIMARRAATPGLHGGIATDVLDAGNPAIFAFARRSPTGTILCLFNFTENWQQVPGHWLRYHGVQDMRDLLSDAVVTLHGGNLALPPYGRVWMT